jgi:methionine synthase II (cobalamin-independent)
MTINDSSPLRFMRVDQVGSLLRPAFLKDTFVQHERGFISEEALIQAQDEAIRQVIAKQDAHHLPIVTDGEYRRINFMASFADVAGYELWKSHWQSLPSPEEQVFVDQAEQRQEREKKGGRGLITTKTGRVETVDELLRRIEDAARYISLDQLALNPQCGFASEIGGNLLSEEDQWRKLDVMLETAARIWG